MAGVPERIYQPQVSAGGSTPQRGGTPEQYGAGVGAQMERLGGQLEGAQLAAYRADLDRQKASEASDVGVQLARLRASAPEQIEQLRDAAPADGAGHVKQVDGWLQTQTDKILGGVQNHEVAEHFRGVAENMRASLIGDETAWAHGQRALHLVSNAGETARLLSTQEATAPSDHVGDSLNLFAKTVQGLGLDANTAEKATREGQRDIAVANLRGRIDTGHPEAALALVDSGVFNQYGLTDEDISGLRAHAETEIRRKQVELRQALTEQRQDANTFLQTITDRVTNHIPVPPEDFQRAGTLLANPDLKLDGKLFDMGKMAAYDHFARVYRNASPVTISGRIKRLDAEIAEKGDKVDPSHVLERDWLATALPQRSAEQRGDPLARYARGGGELTPIDWDDPKTLGNRLIHARLAQGRDGGPLTVLQEEEAAPLRQQMESGGAAGRVEVANALAQGGSDFAVAAARQIAPHDMHFRVAAALAAIGPQGRAAARDSLLGSEAIATHRTIVREDVAQRVFGQHADALTGLDPQMQHGLYDTALGIFATRRLKQGKVEWPNAKQGGDDGDARAAFRWAINAALGASRRPNGEVEGGFGEWAGHMIVLPGGMSQREFETAFSRASPDDFARAAGGVTPVFANGHAPTWGQFKSLKLEAVGDGLYRLRFGNGYLGRADGHGIYEIDARKLRGH
jgi:hypothetical protein